MTHASFRAHVKIASRIVSYGLATERCRKEAAYSTNDQRDSDGFHTVSLYFCAHVFIY